MIQSMREIGFENLVFGTDRGQIDALHPAQSMLNFVAVLFG